MKSEFCTTLKGENRGWSTSTAKSNIHVKKFWCGKVKGTELICASNTLNFCDILGDLYGKIFRLISSSVGRFVEWINTLSNSENSFPPASVISSSSAKSRNDIAYEDAQVNCVKYLIPTWCAPTASGRRFLLPWRRLCPVRRRRGNV